MNTMIWRLYGLFHIIDDEKKGGKRFRTRLAVGKHFPYPPDSAGHEPPDEGKH
jgi:hypothetical protein